MENADFIKLLEQHDWYYDRSDDNRAYNAGSRSRDKLLYLCQEQPELFRLYNHAQNCIITSRPFDFQSVLGTLPREDEKQHTQTNTPSNTMKEIFTLFFDICVKPLIVAINNLAQASGTTAPVPEAPTPAAEKPAKAAKAKAAEKAPAPEPEPEASTISEARLKATVMTLPNEGKVKLKGYFQKKFGYNTMAEIAEEHRADIHAAAVKIGATDTDPEAEVEM